MKCLLNYSNPLKIKFEVIETYWIENKSYSCLEIAFLDFREQKKTNFQEIPTSDCALKLNRTFLIVKIYVAEQLKYNW